MKKKKVLAAGALLVGMAFYELLKELLFPEMSALASHAATVVFVAAAGTLAIDFALKKLDDSKRALQDERKRREQVEQDLSEAREVNEEAMRELKKTVEKARLLSGLLPICMTCEKIRGDEGRWETLEKYMIKHPEAAFSRTVCDQCLKIIYSDAPNRAADE